MMTMLKGMKFFRNMRKKQNCLISHMKTRVYLSLFIRHIIYTLKKEEVQCNVLNVGRSIEISADILVFKRCRYDIHRFSAFLNFLIFDQNFDSYREFQPKFHP